MKKYRIPNEKRIKFILSALKEFFPNVKVALDYSNDFELLVSVILSAQCTDERVNKVTPALFKYFPSVYAFADANPDDLKKLIFSTGFYNNKTKNIIGAAKKVVSDFKGVLPKTMKELLTIPGVARKSANVVLNSLFGINEGIIVDTHVIRISGKLGLVDIKLSASKNAVKIESELMKLIPKSQWGDFAHRLVHFGRQICIARKPKCDKCPLNEVCPSAFDL